MCVGWYSRYYDYVKDKSETYVGGQRRPTPCQAHVVAVGASKQYNAVYLTLLDVWIKKIGFLIACFKLWKLAFEWEQSS